MLSRLVRAVSRGLPFAEPGPRLLAHHRRTVVRRLVTETQPQVDLLAAEVVGGDPQAVAQYDALIAAVVERLRASRGEAACGILHRVDRAFHRDGEEYIDDPSFPERDRVRVIDSLDRFNADTGAYERWFGLVEPLVARAERAGGPVRIHELAAGHGSFALHLAERLGDRARVVASDIRPEYLDLGRRRAAERGVDVELVHQDATDLHDLGGTDVLVCTQSLHHFPPGMIGRMCGEVARAARIGAVFVDGERSLLAMMLATPTLFAYGRSWPVVHDSVVSLRRMYLAEELLLLARLAPALPHEVDIEAGRVPPGYAFVRCTR